ncbi:MFS transporter [Streptomyces decoyicus]|uniref:MFS transporter n=1 Tax=Streptomyces decoyicus TaxID=249567 RepID=UPI0033FED51C
MERFGAKPWLTRIMITWGLVATAMAWVTSTEMFYVLRFLLGVAEAGFFPAVIYYFARWLPDADRGRATAVFLTGSGTAAVIAGPLSGALLEIFAVSLALYAVTFWLPSIVDDIAGLSEFQVGLLVAVPWLCALAAVYVTGRASDRTGRRRPFLAGPLLAGSAGTLLATLVSPWLALAALCLAAMGFKTSSPVFWTIPQSYLDARIAAPAIALVNSLGNLGGFVSPTAFGILQDATGSTRGGLIGLSVVGVLAAVGVALVRGGGHHERARGLRPRVKDHGPGRGPVRGGPARVR